MRIFFRGVARLVRGSVVHRVFVSVPSELDGFTRFFGLGGKGNGSEKVLWRGSDERCVRAAATGGGFNLRCGLRLRPCASGERGRKDQQKESREKTTHRRAPSKGENLNVFRE